MHDSIEYASFGPLKRQNEYVETPMGLGRRGDLEAEGRTAKPAVAAAAVWMNERRS